MDVTLVTIYLGRDNDASVQLYRFSQASLRDVPLNTSAVTRMLVTLVGSDPLIQFDSDLQPGAVTWNSSGLISFALSDYAVQAGGYPIQIVAFSPARPDGEVISDFDLSPVAIEFRDDYSSGVTPPPLVQFVPEAPEDGQLYGRRNATWAPIDDVVAGVASVNGKSGVVLLDTDDVPEGAANHYYPQADQDKLAGVEAGATANQTDAYLLNRANHTGTQPSSTIAAFGADVRAEVEAELVAGANVTITPSGTGATRQLTIAAVGGSASWGGIGGTLADQADLVAALADKANSADLATVAETGSYNDLADKPSIPSNTDAVAEGSTNLYFTVARVRNTVLAGLSLVTNAAITATDTVLDAFGKLQAQITSHFGVGGTTHPGATTSVAGFMSAADKTKLDGVAAGATANSSDATLLNRANHTGTQAASTISDFNAAARAQVEAELVAGSNITITPSGSGATRQLTIASAGGSAVATQSASSSSGALDLSATTAPVVLVTLTENITAITLPAGVAGQSVERRIMFTQGGAGNYTVSGWTGVTVDGGGSAPAAATGAGAVTAYVLANDNNTGWRMYLDASEGLGNRAINGDFSVNQLNPGATSGTVTLTAGQYGWAATGTKGFDRWKAGASGCTYSFSVAGGVTTITITAGSLQQVIASENLQAGTHTLSWGGTSQGKIGTGGYSASGVTGSVTGGSNLTIEFGTGTLSQVQFEPGVIATPFKHRLYGTELSLCQRYYQAHGKFRASQYAAGVATFGAPLPINPPMRATPSVVLGAASVYSNATNIALVPESYSTAYWKWDSLAAGQSYWAIDSTALSAEL